MVRRNHTALKSWADFAANCAALCPARSRSAPNPAWCGVFEWCCTTGDDLCMASLGAPLNRPRPTSRKGPWTIPHSNHFYGGNIVLEDEPAFDFVGFSLDIPARTIRYNRSCHIKDLPSPLSASSQSTLVSGLLALAHTIRQCAYLPSQVHSDLCYLWSLASERKLPVHNTAFFQKFWNVRRSNKQPKSTMRCSVLSCSTMQAPVLFVVPAEQTGSSHQFLRSYC